MIAGIWLIVIVIKISKPLTNYRYGCRMEGKLSSYKIYMEVLMEQFLQNNGIWLITIALLVTIALFTYNVLNFLKFRKHPKNEIIPIARLGNIGALQFPFAFSNTFLLICLVFLTPLSISAHKDNRLEDLYYILSIWLILFVFGTITTAVTKHLFHKKKI